MKFNKQKVMKVLPFVILGYAFNKVSQAFTSAAGTELGDKIMNGMDSLGEVFLNPLPSFNPIDILIGIAGGVIIKLAIYIKGKDAKNTVKAVSTALPVGVMPKILSHIWLKSLRITSFLPKRNV